MTESNIGYKICRTGDLVIQYDAGLDGAMGVVTSRGIVSPPMCVYRPYMARRNAGLLRLPLPDSALRSEVHGRSHGIGSARAIACTADDF